MSHICESCGMPIENGTYCAHCVDSRGQLQAFDERFERMVQWRLHEDPTLDRAGAEAQTLQHLKKMPAWKEHPKVKRRKS